MKISLNGKQIDAGAGRTVLEAARAAGVYIPSLCDIPRLEPFGGCRLCLIEISGRRGYVPACCTSVEAGMEVRSDTPALQKIRREILELILTEHPNACLICTEKESCDEHKSTIRKVGETTGCVLCPNNGRCELQDVVEAVGLDRVRFPAVYRNIDIKKTDPFFDRDYNLCILCGRCVRTCQEERGAGTISFIRRGSEAVVGTVLDVPLLEAGCQMCGACVDACPTGALTERALKYEQPAERTDSIICPVCGMGCRMDVSLLGGRIIGSRPAPDGPANGGQACVRGRFLLREIPGSDLRITRPMIRRKKDLEEVEWAEALDFVAGRLKSFKKDEIGLVYSTQLTTEDIFALKKFGRDVLKTKRVLPSSASGAPDMMMDLAGTNGSISSLICDLNAVAEADTLVVCGSDLPRAHPIAWVNVLKALKKDAGLVVAGTADSSMDRHADVTLRVKPGGESALYGLLAGKMITNGREKSGALGPGSEKVFAFYESQKEKALLDSSGIEKMSSVETAAALLLKKGKTVILWDTGTVPDDREKEAAVHLWNLALLTGARLLPLSSTGNSRGAAEIRRSFAAEPTASAFTQDAAEGRIKALYLAGPFPVLKTKKTEFTVLQASFWSEASAKADAVFPAAVFAETEGTFVNTEGRLQYSPRVLEPPDGVKEDWRIVSLLSQMMNRGDFSFKNASGILKEASEAVPSFAGATLGRLKDSTGRFLKSAGDNPLKLILPPEKPMTIPTNKSYPLLLECRDSADGYRELLFAVAHPGFALLRDPEAVWLNPKDAKSLKLGDGDPIKVSFLGGSFGAVARLSDGVPVGAARTIYAGGLLPELSFVPPASVFPVKITRGQ
ncbi:MAG: molybdopterin-dependent oxidoreductase [Acidobacteria bacterium]|nr:molybdopterin-dependent oxidoreductase [Acidobacteriota bacterium]